MGVLLENAKASALANLKVPSQSRNSLKKGFKVSRTYF